MKKILIADYIQLFIKTKTIKEIANDLGFKYNYVGAIHRELKTGYLIVHSKINTVKKA